MENIDFKHIADLIDKASRCKHCSELASLAAEEYEAMPEIFAKVIMIAQQKAAPVQQTTNASTPLNKPHPGADVFKKY